MDHIDPSVREYVNHPTIAREYDTCFALHPLFTYDETFLADRVVPGSRVLDLGVGTGRHLVQLSRMGCRVTGLDLSPHMLNEASKKLAESSLVASLVQADMLSLPIALRPCFDVALLMFSTLGLIHGAENRKHLLLEIRDRIKDDGRLILHVHNDRYRNSPHRPLRKRLRDGIGRLQKELEVGDHIIANYRGLMDLRLHSFSLEEFTSLLAAADFEIFHIEGLNDFRDGPCEHADISRYGNGFIAIAVPKLD